MSAGVLVGRVPRDGLEHVSRALRWRAGVVDSRDMSPSQVTDGSELEFFGVKLKVNNPRLAALLNSDVTEDVQVNGRRAREALSGADDERA